MKKSYFSNRFSPLVVLIFITLSGCGYLIQPRLVADIQEYEKGRYQLDQTHAAVIQLDLLALNALG